MAYPAESYPAGNLGDGRGRRLMTCYAQHDRWQESGRRIERTLAPLAAALANLSAADRAKLAAMLEQRQEAKR